MEDQMLKPSAQTRKGQPWGLLAQKYKEVAAKRYDLS